jgi:hypothetical protein
MAPGHVQGAPRCVTWTRYNVTIIANLDPSTAPLFFMPGVASSGLEDEYLRLQECALRETGSAPVERRIRQLACRVAGRDCTIEVGGPDPVDGTDVVAIIDLGRHLPYGIFTTADAEAPAMLADKPVYSVTDFG